MSTPEKQLKKEELFANKVVIALIDSPLYEDKLDTNEVDNFFKNYFHEAHKHKLNDRIFFRSRRTPSNLYFYKLF